MSEYGDGCDLHPHCLSCPRRYCIYDDKPGLPLSRVRPYREAAKKAKEEASK